MAYADHDCDCYIRENWAKNESSHTAESHYEGSYDSFEDDNCNCRYKQEKAAFNSAHESNRAAFIQAHECQKCGLFFTSPDAPHDCKTITMETRQVLALERIAETLEKLFKCATNPMEEGWLNAAVADGN